jgi:hypothetical protein
MPDRATALAFIGSMAATWAYPFALKTEEFNWSALTYVEGA